MESVSSKAGSQQLSVPNKRSVQVESSSCKPGPQQLGMSKKRTAQMEPSPKSQTESFDSVRSKLRESLTASLAMVSQQQSKLSTVGQNSERKVASAPKQLHNAPQPAELAPANVDVALSHVPEGRLEILFSKDHQSVQKHTNDQSSSHETFSGENIEDAAMNWKCDGQEFQLKPIIPEEDISFSNSFLINDELLQGNGLCWATDLDAGPAETMEGHSAKRPKLLNEKVCPESGELKSLSPETLAFKIEAELFKLFGGVNKKYKEKGRSLLFNLKDRSNPELRERVMSGEISPERLCSMTAEELASEELSQWRLAKAEELAQMIVLPDAEVDVRRLVRKTHKGEFQVEVEHDASVSVEVSVGASSLAQIQSKPDEKVAQLQSKGTKAETSDAADVNDSNNSVDHNLQSGVTTLPHDGIDPMQGLMVDELKDAEFLPPIVSLDEFMESLDSEPPFENLPVDAVQATLVSEEKNTSDIDSKLDSSDIGLVDPTDTSPNKLDKNEAKYTRTNSNTKSNSMKTEVKYTRTGSNIKSNNILTVSETSPGGDTSKVVYVWEGVLQLNISTTVMVSGIYRSGEKTSTKEWPSLLEIKGRVRLDAFEKFLQELPMSRSRAIMVVQFCWKEGSPDNGDMNLCEVADSYVADERVGFAEPVPGVELYFCPPHSRIFEMLGKHLSKDHTETLNSADNGLIGIVVWRKAFETSTISPNSSSHHKHNLKKQNSLRRHQEKGTNVNAMSKPPLPLDDPPSKPEPPLDDEPIDDVPPGFGPAAARDDDDLPEFHFVRPPNPPVVPQFPGPNPSLGPGMTLLHAPAPSPLYQPVEQMRDLVHKYGQGIKNASSVNWQQRLGVGVEIQPWNDDDDIPEWQPQPPTHQLPPPPPLVHGFRQPTQRIIVNPQHLVSLSSQHPSQPLGPLAPQPQHLMPLQPLQPPMNMTQLQGQQTGAPAWQQGSWWAQPPVTHGLPVQAGGSMQPYYYGDQPNEGQFYRTPGFGAMQNNMERRQDTSRSREF